MGIRKKLIRERVELLLKAAGTSEPPVGLEAVAGFLNLKIEEKFAPGDEEISGCLIRQDGHGVIGVNPNHHPNRRRFTIAHEIGHYLLHKGEKVHLDRTHAFHVNFRDAKSSAALYPEEIEANLFAAELLMPATFLEKVADFDLSEDDLQGLAQKFQVSVQALTYRLMNLGLISGVEV